MLHGDRMKNGLRVVDGRLGRLGRAEILVLAAFGVLFVGGVDYLSGHELSMSLFYLGPVAVAGWYAGRPTGVAIAVLSCASWYIADMAAWHQYSHPAIPIWNALVRFGFFLVTGLLLTALRKSLLGQQHLARTDALTGLYGRRSFEDRLAHDLALAQRRKSALTLAYVDLDDFKTVNDSRGHAEGDRVSKTVGRVLMSAVRTSDTAARLGGDEFALMFPHTDAGGARNVIAKVRSGLQAALGASDLRVTCSIGVVTSLDPASSPQGLLAVADALMYEVKRGGKGDVSFRVLGGQVAAQESSNAPAATGTKPEPWRPNSGSHSISD